ncbi:hypothetical protein [Nocardioides kribbensis]|uniref:DUF3558 domain-containing protein n=1 Tax=Nocardioides kribbensis TaxID=305517 RepID=A0ABV1P3V9_9ACTN
MRRTLALVPAAVMALSLTACGGSDDSAEPEADASASTSESSSEDASEPAEDSGAEATGQDYVDLITVLFEQQAPEGGYDSAEDFNAQADFPEGVSVGRFEKTDQEVCIQDTDPAIALVFSVNDARVGLLEGSCADGEEQAAVVSSGGNETELEGDEDLATPVRDHLLEGTAG